ncbi:MAG: 4-hydroxy-tetrahydrodipicolinate reductase [Myxococcales bacterium]|nr:4-hydroxy-tetrahydrodipicolinate reductase [Myxococcales bacterium]
MKIGIHGAAGRMGRQIAQEIYAHPEAELTLAVDHASQPGIGQPYDAENAPGLPLSATLDRSAELDVLIDFSSPAGARSVLPWCRERKLPVVIGTTGLAPDEVAFVESHAEAIPLILAPNMSVGVNALFELARIGARTVGLDWEFEIVEAHHRAKKDAPSGTAMRLAEVLADARNSTIDELGVYARHGIIGARSKEEIGVQTIRGGDIIGEHTVYLIGEGERIELTHRALTRAIFAKGAVRAALWLATRAPGRYSMRDVLGL